MRIAVSGAQNLGKSTVVKDFLQKWPKYTTPVKTYRDVLVEKKLNHSKQTTKETQEVLLDWLVTEQKKYRKGDKVIFDRCVLDNLVYTMWSFEKGNSDIDKDFVDKCIPIVKESLRLIDIIFFIPLTKINPVIVEDKLRETDPGYREEIDNIFKAFAAEWHKPTSPFFARDDKPAIIEIFGTPEERMEIVKFYLDNDGDAIGDGKIIDPNEMLRLGQQLGVKPGEDIMNAFR